MSLRNPDQSECWQMEESYLSQLDPRLLETGEAVARLAIKLAGKSRNLGHGYERERQFEEAWEILRHACLIVDATETGRTIEGYKRFGIRPPKEVWEQIKPPPPEPPEPERWPFSELYNKEQETITLKGLNEKGELDSFDWKQLKPYDPQTDDEKKTSFYKHALALVTERMEIRVHTLNDQHMLVERLCSAVGDDFWWLFVSEMDELNRPTKYSVFVEELELFEEAYKETPRPSNARVGKPFQWEGSKGPEFKIYERSCGELPGPPPPEDATAEELYVELVKWAEAVIEVWKARLIAFNFDLFYQTGQERGFLWEDVVGLAHQSKKNKGGIKWKSKLKGSKAAESAAERA